MTETHGVEPTDILLVLTNVPDAQCADRIEQALLGERLVACINRLPAVQSRYVWQGRIESASEIPLLIKTRAQCWDAVEARILALHPYEVPEIIAIKAERVLASYAAWIAGLASAAMVPSLPGGKAGR